MEKHGKKIQNLIGSFETENNLTNSDNIYYMIIIDGIDECGLSYDERLKTI